MGKRLSRLSLSDFIEILKHSWTISSTISNVATCRFESNFAFRVVPFAVRLNHSCSPNCQQSWDEESGNLATSQLQDLLPNLNFKDAMDMHILCMHHAVTSSCKGRKSSMPWQRFSQVKSFVTRQNVEKTQHCPPLVLYTVPYTVGSLGKLWVCGWFGYFWFLFLILWYGMVRCNLFMHSLQCSDLAGLFPRRVQRFFTSRHVVKIQINIYIYNQWKDWFVVACKSNIWFARKCCTAKICQGITYCDLREPREKRREVLRAKQHGQVIRKIHMILHA